MALLFYDGFDWAFNSTDVQRAWDSMANCSFGTQYGRLGSKGCAITSFAAYIIKSFASKSTIYFGTAMNFSSANIVYNQAYPLFIFRSGTTMQVRLHYISATSCAFYNGSGSQQIGPTINIPNTINKWVYLEFKVTISDTVGEIIFKINGVEYYNGTNLDTRNGTPTDIDNIHISAINNANTWYDDIYIDDSQFHGDVRIRTIYPGVNGSTNNFSVYPSGSNYQAVDDPGDPDDDTTYNYANTVGNIDLYKITAPTLSTVKALSVSNMLRKDDAGIRTIKNLCRSGGSNYQGSEFIVPDNYSMNKHIWETDPQDSNPWTEAKINAAEFGLEITA